MIRFKKNSIEKLPKVWGNTSSTKKEKEKEDFKSTSFAGNQGGSVSSMPIEIDIEPLLKGIIFSEDLEQKKLVHRLYRDIYYNDPVCGSAVDLNSSLPFSDFTIGGITDKKANAIFNETLERLNTRTILPDISTDFMVQGEFIGSLLYNSVTKKFFDIMPHQGDNCRIESLPFYSQDPIITVAFPDSVKAAISRDSDRIIKLKERLGTSLVEALSTSTLELDPVSTIYLARRAFSTGEGVSYFRRVLPIYLMEKNLFRGTLVQSARRQKGILHVTLGLGEEWEPTMADMEAITDLFNNADADPVGAVIATRAGVDSQEILDPSGGWKWMDSVDQFAQYKMKALNISEQLLSADASWSTMDATLTIAIDNMRSYRDMITRKLFYNKIFPLISLVNGYTTNSRGKLVKKENLMDSGNVEDMLSIMQDGSRLLIPTIHWAKQLKPEGDTAYLDMLTQLTEKGVPVPLRAFAAAGGFNLDNLLATTEDDVDLLRRVSEYKKRVDEIKKEFGPAAVEGEGDMGGFASSLSRSDIESLKRLAGTAVGSHSDVLSATAGVRPGLVDRDYGESQEITDVTKTGKKKWVYNQKRANEKANRNIAKAMAHIEKNKKTPLTHRSITTKE